MMISSDYYYEINLKGKTKEEILKEIRSLKREISRLKKVIAEGENSPENMIDPSPSTRISCSREYLEEAIRAYEEAGGEYVPTKAELKEKAFNDSLEYLESITFTYGGYLIGEEERTVTITEDLVTMESYSLFGKPLLEYPEDQIYEKDEFLEQLKGLHISEWKRSYEELLIMDGVQWELKLKFSNRKRAVRYSGSNAFPYNFDAVLDLFNVRPIVDTYFEGEEDEQDQN